MNCSSSIAPPRHSYQSSASAASYGRRRWLPKCTEVRQTVDVARNRTISLRKLAQPGLIHCLGVLSQNPYKARAPVCVSQLRWLVQGWSRYLGEIAIESGDFSDDNLQHILPKLRCCRHRIVRVTGTLSPGAIGLYDGTRQIDVQP